MHRKAYLSFFSVFFFLLMLPACSRTDNDVGTVRHDGGGATGGTSSATGGTSGSGGTTSAQSCTYNGKTYAVGETFKVDCNTCSCGALGDTLVRCTVMACSGAGGSGPTTGGSSGTGGISGGGGGGASPDAKVVPDGAVCDQLSAAARTQFQSYLDSTSSMACQADSDCSLLHLQSLNCFAACGQLVGTANTSTVTTAAASVCDQYFAAGCPEIKLLCPTSGSFCNHGQCDYVTPGSTGTGGASGGTSGGGGVSTGGAGGAVDAVVAPDAAVCDQLSAAARTQYQSYLNSTASLACQVDSDCSFLFPPQTYYCFTSCGDVVGAADISAVTAATASVCDEYWAAGCPGLRPLPCPPSFKSCDHNRCVRDGGAGGSSGSGGDGGISDTGGTTGTDGGVSVDSVASSKCSACGTDELCVGYYDGMCTPMSTNCVKVSAATRESILVKHESCFMKPTGDEICGNRDGGVFWGCGAPPCPNEPLVADINCYGP